MKVQSIKNSFIIFLLTLSFISPSYSNEDKNIVNNFKLFIEKEFLSNNVKTKSNLSSNHFSIFDIKFLF